MGTDKGLAGKTWSEPSHCPLGYTAWHFEPSEYSTYSKHTKSVYANAVRKCNHYHAKELRN